MGFLSLYRKYRPKNFEDLVGQQHVVQTLRNALEYDRIAHAYLFAGPRGTGKTSTAKVFAQALNCVDGPTTKPCGHCDNCHKIQSGQSMDVIEIDAASNRGIDEIRELRDKVKFFPGEGSYKVYIIDEVHMLTKGAFNALLKTLEEPPDNVVFILATTEPHKVIDTILSRCQRFDFTLHSFEGIKKRLEFICSEEGVKYSTEALNTIVNSANGGLRDAISLLDQAISYTNSNLTLKDIQKMLGKVDKEDLFKFFTAIVNQKTADALEMANDIINRGNSISVFIEDMIEHVRQLLIIKECGSTSGILDFPAEVLSELEKKSEDLSTGRLLYLIEILSQLERELNYSSQPRLVVEMGIVKMVAPEGNDLVSGLIQRVEELENMVNKLISNRGSASVVVDSSDEAEQVGPDSEDSGDSEDLKLAKGNKQLTLDQARENWPDILSRIKEKDIKVNAFLLEGQPVRLEDGQLFIQFPPDKNFHKKGAEQAADFIAKIISQVLGERCQPVFELIANNEGVNKKKIIIDSKDKRRDDEKDLVNQVVKAFNGEVIKVNYEQLEK